MALPAAKVAAQVIGLVGGILGIVQFGQDSMPSHAPNVADNSSLRIALGMDNVNVSNAQGSIGNLKVYNEFQTLVGAGSGGYIDAGSIQDFNINQHYGPGQQPTYVQNNVADDGVCIAYITQTWPDGKQHGWLGDIGQVCGAQWTYSNVVVNVDNYKPLCTWIDQNHDNNNPTAGLQIHMTDFTLNGTAAYSTDTAHYCSWPTMYFSASTDSQGMPDNQIWGGRARKAACQSSVEPSELGL